MTQEIAPQLVGAQITEFRQLFDGPPVIGTRFDFGDQFLHRCQGVAPAVLVVEVHQQFLQRDIGIDLRVGGGVLRQFDQRQQAANTAEVVNSGRDDSRIAHHIRRRTAEPDRVLHIRKRIAAAVPVPVARGDHHRLPRSQVGFPAVFNPAAPPAGNQVGQRIKFKKPDRAIPETPRRRSAGCAAVDDPESVAPLQLRHPSGQPMYRNLARSVPVKTYFVIIHAAFFHLSFDFLWYNILHTTIFCQSQL